MFIKIHAEHTRPDQCFSAADVAWIKTEDVSSVRMQNNKLLISVGIDEFRISGEEINKVAKQLEEILENKVAKI